MRGVSPPQFADNMFALVDCMRINNSVFKESNVMSFQWKTTEKPENKKINTSAKATI